MAALARSAATLRIVGDSLISDDVTLALGTAPSESQAKGQELRRKDGSIRIAKFGMWRLHASETAPADLDAQVREILATLTSDLSIWSALSAKFDIDLFCGWFMEQGNEGLSILPETLHALGARDIKLALDVYAPVDD
jgi:Domain of unknown function (DUF4279)